MCEVTKLNNEQNLMMGKKFFWNKSVMKYRALNLGQIRDGE